MANFLNKMLLEEFEVKNDTRWRALQILFRSLRNKKDEYINIERILDLFYSVPTVSSPPSWNRSFYETNMVYEDFNLSTSKVKTNKLDDRDSEKCYFCKNKLRDIHNPKNYVVTLTRNRVYNQLFVVNLTCFQYFRTTVLFSPHYEKYIMINSIKDDKSILVIPKDIIKIISNFLIILTFRFF